MYDLYVLVYFLQLTDFVSNVHKSSHVNVNNGSFFAYIECNKVILLHILTAIIYVLFK